MGYLDITSEGPVDVDPVRRARQDEGDEVMGVLRVGLSRSTVPRAAFSERRGGLSHGGIRTKIMTTITWFQSSPCLVSSSAT